MSRPNKRRLTVYSDASFGHYIAGISAIAVVDDLIVEQTASAFSTQHAKTEEFEMLGLISAAALATKLVKRLKLRNSTVKLLCDNQGTIALSHNEPRLEPYFEVLRKHGINVCITYIDGNHPIHHLCHLASNRFRRNVQQEIQDEHKQQMQESPRKKQLQDFNKMLFKS
jgi:hypothetical protein